MDYLRSLENEIRELQRRAHLLGELRALVDSSDDAALASFVAELEAVECSSGASVAQVLRTAFASGRVSEARPGSAPPSMTPPGMAKIPVNDSQEGLRSRVAPIVRRKTEPSADAAEPSARPETAEAGETSLPKSATSGRDDALASISATMVEIPGGRFLMGSEAADNEKPPHTVGVDRFFLSSRLATNAEYRLFALDRPEWSKDKAASELRDGDYLRDWNGDDFPEDKGDSPVAFFSWYAAEAFAAWLGMRLPTEVEWEFAARGGLAGKKFPSGDQMNEKLANFAKKCGGTTVAGRFPANAFGLYDMAGNLFEWTADWYAPYPPGEGGPPSQGEYKVIRGGSWMSGAGALRVSARVDEDPARCGAIGVRLAR